MFAVAGYHAVVGDAFICMSVNLSIITLLILPSRILFANFAPQEQTDLGLRSLWRHSRLYVCGKNCISTPYKKG